MGNFSRESILYFNRKSQIYNNCPILVGKNEEEAELNEKEGRTRAHFNGKDSCVYFAEKEN